MDRRDYAYRFRTIINDVNEALSEEGMNPLITHKEVCPSCNGEGKYVNPGVDSHGISPDEFYEDPDFGEAYFSGAYDVRCEECGGRNVVDAVDEGLTDEASLTYYNNWMRDMYDDLATQAAEMRMGC